MTTKSTPTQKKAGRRSETPEQRLERAQRDVELAKAAVRAQEERKFAVVGRALLDEAAGNTAFMDTLRDVLKKRVTGKAALADIASLFNLAAVTPPVTNEAPAITAAAKAA